jgi:thiol-disulfide isomerase/thioredoxin
MLHTITTIENLKQFNELLLNNPGFLVIKFGAEWCGPCKKVEQDVQKWFERMPDNVRTVMLDIDRRGFSYWGVTHEYVKSPENFVMGY